MRGSWTFGPVAFSMVEGNQRITEYRTSSGDQSGSSCGVGASRATIPFLNPAASNAGCQSSMALRIQGLSQVGVAGST